MGKVRLDGHCNDMAVMADGTKIGCGRRPDHGGKWHREHWREGVGGKWIEVVARWPKSR